MPYRPETNMGKHLIMNTSPGTGGSQISYEDPMELVDLGDEDYEIVDLGDEDYEIIEEED